MIAKEPQNENAMYKLTSSVTNPASIAMDARLLERALLIRRVEQRLLQLFSEGKLFGTRRFRA